MARCWYENSEKRPSFDELATELDRALVGYVELNMELKLPFPRRNSVSDCVVSFETKLNAVLMEALFFVIVIALSKFKQK